MNLDRVIAVRTNKTVYRDGDRVIKVFSEDYSKADVLNEALNQARVEETGLNIPKLLEVTMIDGKWVLESEFISGKTMAQLVKENPDKKEEYFNYFVDLQLDMNKRKAPGLSKLKDKINEKISMSDLDATTRYDLHTRLEGMPKHTKLCHGDYNMSNIIIAEDGKPFIIDWAHATQGNTSADAARTYLMFWLEGDIEGANRYLDLFCKKGDIAKQYIQKWLPIVAAAQSVKGKPEERELLLSWVNVVEYE